jgi:hypothetical protein
MSQEIEFVKEQVLNQFRKKNSDVGHSLNIRGFNIGEVRRWNPKQQDALKSALIVLEEEGIVTDPNGSVLLTAKGVDLIYPDIGDFAKEAILLSFTKSNARVGHAFNEKSFLHTQILHWNPKQKSGYEAAMESLISDDLVDVNLCLTQKGYDTIY